jgi:hypothetical protein
MIILAMGVISAALIYALIELKDAVEHDTE